MQVHTNWNEPTSWLISFILVVLLIGQGILIARNQSLTASRKWVRTGLNLLLWLVVVGYFLQISWSASHPATHALVAGTDVPSAFVRRVQDSLHVQDAFTTRSFKDDYDSVTLVGQTFPTEFLTRFSQSAVQWIPYNQPDQIQELGWKSLVRQGEMQRITGWIQSSKPQPLLVRYGNRTLDSVGLSEGQNAFTLQFPAFARGRTQAELALGSGRTSATLDTIRFFTRLTRPMSVQFLLDNPDFESKTLADWLGKQGHTVQLSTTLAKNVSSRVSINKRDQSAKASERNSGAINRPDIIITDPANAADATVRKAVADGRSVLFINLVNPETECRVINQALGSHWQIRKITNEAVVPISNGLNALPYRFIDVANQFAVAGYPVAVQRTTGRVSVSLLSETFPLSLSGDSLAYNRIWYAIMAQLQPVSTDNVQVSGPIFKGLSETIRINNPSTRSNALRIGNDTVKLGYSPINEQSADGRYIVTHAGWQPVQDSLAVYVERDHERNPVAQRSLMSRFMLAHNQGKTPLASTTRQAEETVPDWVWLLLFLTCFTAVWVEPKLNL